jgi:integrase
LPEYACSRKSGTARHPFSLRHSIAAILLSMGVPAKVVQEILGHSHISSTLGIYAHVLPGMQKEAMDNMNTWFGNDSEEENTPN